MITISHTTICGAALSKVISVGCRMRSPTSKKLLRIQPSYGLAHYNLGTTLFPKFPDACRRYSSNCRKLSSPRSGHDAKVHQQPLGKALAQDTTRLPDAITEYQTALRIDPGVLTRRPQQPRQRARTNLRRLASRDQEIFEPPRQSVPIPRKRTTTSPTPSLSLRNMQRKLSRNIRPRYAYDPTTRRRITNWEASSPETASSPPPSSSSTPRYAPTRRTRRRSISICGSALAQSGKTADAIAHWQTTLKIDPNHARAHYNLGIALAQLGRPKDAIAELEIAMRLAPDPHTQNIIDDLRANRL